MNPTTRRTSSPAQTRSPSSSPRCRSDTGTAPPALPAETEPSPGKNFAGPCAMMSPYALWNPEMAGTAFPHQEPRAALIGDQPLGAQRLVADNLAKDERVGRRQRHPRESLRPPGPACAPRARRRPERSHAPAASTAGAHWAGTQIPCSCCAPASMPTVKVRRFGSSANLILQKALRSLSVFCAGDEVLSVDAVWKIVLGLTRNPAP